MDHREQVDIVSVRQSQQFAKLDQATQRSIETCLQAEDRITKHVSEQALQLYQGMEEITTKAEEHVLFALTDLDQGNRLEHYETHAELA